MAQKRLKSLLWIVHSDQTSEAMQSRLAEQLDSVEIGGEQERQEILQQQATHIGRKKRPDASFPASCSELYPVKEPPEAPKFLPEELRSAQLVGQKLFPRNVRLLCPILSWQQP